MVYCSALEKHRVRDSPVGSNPTPSANLFQVHLLDSVERDADVALAVERVLGKDEVPSSILGISTILQASLVSITMLIFQSPPFCLIRVTYG